MKCKFCGGKFNEDDAAEEYNDYFCGSHDYSYDGWEGSCAECAISGQEYQDDSDEYDDDPPDGCRECGGDYPNCLNSCPLYDD